MHAFKASLNESFSCADSTYQSSGIEPVPPSRTTTEAAAAVAVLSAGQSVCCDESCMLLQHSYHKLDSNSRCKLFTWAWACAWDRLPPPKPPPTAAEQEQQQQQQQEGKCGV
jgi:hypothetical protein